MVTVTCESCGKTFTLQQLIDAGYTLQDIINWEQECFDLQKENQKQHNIYNQRRKNT